MPRSQPGESNPAARLTEADVHRMRGLYMTGLIRQGELVSLFRVSRGTVQAVVQGRHWRHLEPTVLIPQIENSLISTESESMFTDRGGAR